MTNVARQYGWCINFQQWIKSTKTQCGVGAVKVGRYGSQPDDGTCNTCPYCLPKQTDHCGGLNPALTYEWDRNPGVGDLFSYAMSRAVMEKEYYVVCRDDRGNATYRHATAEEVEQLRFLKADEVYREILGHIGRVK